MSPEQIEPTPDSPSEMAKNLRQDIEEAINKHCGENGSDTPDFILAEYLVACLDAFDTATEQREKWYGRSIGDWNTHAKILADKV